MVVRCSRNCIGQSIQEQHGTTVFNNEAAIQSDNYLIGNVGGAPGVKMGLFFGAKNAYQWFAHLVEARHFSNGN